MICFQEFPSRRTAYFHCQCSSLRRLGGSTQPSGSALHIRGAICSHQCYSIRHLPALFRQAPSISSWKSGHTQNSKAQFAKSANPCKISSSRSILIMSREQDGAESLLQSAGFLFAKGYKVAMERVNAIEVLDTLTNQTSNIEIGTTIVDLP